MNWDQIAGRWKQMKGQAQQRWSSLTEDDWQRIDGRREELVGRIQERYGRNREEAEREVDDWSRGIH